MKYLSPYTAENILPVIDESWKMYEQMRDHYAEKLATAFGLPENYLFPDKKLLETLMNDRPDHILQFFSFDHLPGNLQEVSRHFSDLAGTIMELLPRNPERTVALRKLLEVKDAAVRTMIAKDE